MVFRYRNLRHPVHQLRNDMDRMLTGMFGPWAGVEWPTFSRGQPAVNLWEAEDAVVVETEVPGLKNEQIDISVVGDQLSLKIERPDIQQEGVTYHRRERPVGAFNRVLRLPAEVDPDRVEAELRNGVLTIILPKAEAAKPRKIQVNPAL
jgi:HSP20 family protein